MEDFSVIKARDPSITGWSRPKAGMSLIKNLRSIFEAEDSSCSSSKQPLKVYLRMKPYLPADGASLSANFSILDEHTLSTFAPVDSVTFKNQGSSVTHQFKFSKIFGPASSQKDVFDECVSESVQDFVIGNNGLIFAYGTTNAGKTFTVQGTESKPGLIPRALDFLFKQISGKEAHVGRYKPEKVDGIVELDDISIANDAKYKQKILQWDWEHHLQKEGDDLCSSNSSDFISNAFRGMQKTILEESPNVEEHKEGDVVFSVWVSYAEIYNDYIYDLLEPIQGVGTRRVPLKLAMDSNGNTYIKDLRHIHVASGDEAFQVMLYGKTHLQVSATKMNSSSSRSHSVFTVKLVRYVNSDESPTYARVSNFSFCDLAGAERVKKTLNVGERLKESSNINTSLHVLGRCLTTIKENQSSKYKKQIPFRESKLTRLFQRALQGHEGIAMIVNVNPSSTLYDETVHVLKFSAIANQIVLQTPIKRARREHKKKSRFSSLALRPSKSICWENPSDDEVDSVRSSAVDDLVAQNEALMDKLSKMYEELREERKKSLSIEREIRMSLTAEFMKMIEKSDKTWRERLHAEEARSAEAYEERLAMVEEYYQECIKKRRRMSEDMENTSAELREFETSEMTSSIEDAKGTIKNLEEALDFEKRNVESLKAELKEVRQARDSLLAHNSQLKISIVEAENAAKDNENLLQVSTSGEIVEDLKKQLAEERESVASKTKQIESMKVLLNEAREDIVMLNKEKEEAEEEVDRLEEELAVTKEAVSDLSNKVEELESVIEELTGTVQQNETEVSKCEDTIRSLEQELSRVNTEYPQKIVDLEEQLKSLSVNGDGQGELNAARSELNAARSELDDVRMQLNEALTKSSDFDALLEEKLALESKLREEAQLHEKTLKAFEEQKGKLEEFEAAAKTSFEDERNELTGKIAGLEEEQEALKETITGLQKKASRVEELTQKIYCLEAEKAELKESIRSTLQEEKSHQEERQVLLQKISSLQETVDSLKSSKEEELKGYEERMKKCQSRFEELEEWKLQQKDAISEQMREAEKKHDDELKALQKELKNSLQKNLQLEATILKLEEAVQKSQEESAKMEREVKSALQQSLSQPQASEDKRTQAELVKLLTNAREETDRSKRELKTLQTDNSRLQQALEEMEKEFISFKENREVLMQRFDKSLKEAKDDAERAKKEVVTLTETLYKNPSTPNQKQYESEIWKLKQQIERLEGQNRLLREQTEVLKEKKDLNQSDCSGRSAMDGDFAEPKKRATVKKSTAKSVKGSSEDISIVFAGAEPGESQKSARRTRRKNTTDSEDTCMLPPPSTPHDEDTQRKRTNRNRRLYAPPCSDNFDSENSEPIVMSAEATTPEVFTKNLRSRSRRM